MVAVTVNVYPVPFDNPDTTHDVAGATTEHVAPPGDAVTVYPVISAPPSSPGADHDTDTRPSPPTPNTDVGAPGTVTSGTGVTAADGDDAGPVPALFVAVTVNVYPVPFVNPDTTQLVAPVVVHVCPPGDAVTVYPVTT